MYTIIRSPAAFYEYLIKFIIAPHLTTAAKKIAVFSPDELNLVTCIVVGITSLIVLSIIESFGSI